MSTHFLQSLRGRLLVLFALLAIGPLLTVGVFDYVRSRRMVERLIVTQNDTLARRAAGVIADRYGVIASDMLQLTENADVQAYLRARATGDAARALATHDSAASFLAAAWHVDSASYYSAELRDSTGAVLFRLASNDPSIADGSTPVRAPLRDLAIGKTVGTLILAARPEALFSNDAIGPTFGRTGRTTVIDRSTNRIVYDNGASRRGATAVELFGPAWTSIAQQMSTATGMVAFNDSGARAGAFVRLETPPWTVLSSTGVSEFAETFNRTRTIDLIFLLLLGGAVAIASAILVRRTTRSLEELTRAAVVVGRGDLSPTLPAPAHDEVGTLTRAFGDMVERVRAMMREIEVSRQLAVLGEFSAQLSHEVRNPLTSLKLDLQGMQRQLRSGELPASAAPPIESALRQINRLDTVVRGVLELSAQSRSGHALCSVHEAIDDAVGGVATQLREGRLEVERCYGASDDRTNGDAGLLSGMFMNLLLNAAEAQPEGGAIGVLTTNREIDGARWIEVTIADNGPGIEPARRSEVFRPFYTSRHEGTGLGLSLALRTVRDHGGRIEIVDPPAGYSGAAFVVALWLAPDASA